MNPLTFAPSRRFDVVGLGNAIVDLLAETPADFPERHGVPKGAMRLLESEAEALAFAENLRQAGSFVAESGGSAANTVCGMTLLGKKCAFIGKVANDVAGGEFAEGLRQSDVAFASAAPARGVATGQCCIAVTPDGERSMATYLGAARLLSYKDIEAAPISDAAILYIEGYLWDEGELQTVIRQAVAAAHEADVRVALSLSDPFCVTRHHASLFGFIDSGDVDILFGNDDEFSAMFPGKTDAELTEFFDGRECAAFRTKGAKGAGAFLGGAYTERPALAGIPVIDATGAGDLFAAGAMAALLDGASADACLDLGIRAASHVIARMGGRAEASLTADVAPAMRMLDKSA